MPRLQATEPRVRAMEFTTFGNLVDGNFLTRTFETRYRRLPADGCPTTRQPNPWVFCDIHHAEYPTNSPRDAARRAVELLIGDGLGLVKDGDCFEVMVSDITGSKVLVSLWKVDVSQEWRCDARPAVTP